MAEGIPSHQQHSEDSAENEPLFRWYDGNWPLFQDKVRGGVRSRTLLVLVYMYLTLLVTLFLALSLTVPLTGLHSLSAEVPPPQSVVVGLPAPRIVLRVRDGNNDPVSGVEVTLTIVPVTETVLSTQVNERRLSLGTVRCVRDQILPGTITAVNHQPLCSVPIVSLTEAAAKDGHVTVTQLTQVTDDQGYVTFSNFTILNSFPGYALMRISAETVDQPVEQIIFIETRRVVQLSAQSIASSDMDDGSEIAVVVTDRQAFDVNISATLELTAGLASFQLLPSVLTATVFPIDLGAAFRGTGVAYHQSEYFADTSGAVLVSPTYVTTLKQVMVNSTFPSNFSGVATVQLEFTLHGIRIVDASVATFHVALMFWGAITIIDFAPKFVNAGMTPRQLVPPLLFRPATAAQVSFSVLGPDWQDNALVVREDQVLRLQLLSAVHRCWLYLVPDADFWASTGDATSQTWKILTSQTFASPTEVLNVQFSTAGSVGRYRLFVMCGTRRALFNGSTAGLPLRIVSSVERATVQFSALRSANDGNVGSLYVPFSSLPVVTLTNAAGGAVIGKTVQIVPDEGVVVTAQSSSSDTSGQVTFAYITVIRCVTPDGSNTSFRLVVDDRTIHTFYRTIRVGAPVDATSQLIDIINNQACASIDLSSLPAVFWITTSTSITLTAKSIGSRGLPVALANVSLRVDAQVEGETTPRQTLSSDSDAIVSFTVDLPKFQKDGYLYATVSCGDAFAFVPSSRRFRVLLRHRVRELKVEAIDKNARTVQVRVEADWSRVDRAAPLVVYAVAIWMPVDVAAYFPLDRRVTNSSILVLESQPLNDIVTFSTLAAAGAPPGPVVYAVGADLTPANFWYLAQGKADAAQLELTTAALDTLPTWPLNSTITRVYARLEFGSPLPVQPVVHVRDVRGNPVRDALIYAQLGVVTQTSSGRNVVWLDPANTTADVATGYVSERTPSASPTTLPRAPVRASGDDGFVRFTALTVEGAMVNISLTLRYCCRSTDQTLLCVEETSTVAFGPWQAIVATVTPATLALVPRAVLPTLFVSTHTLVGNVTDVFAMVDLQQTLLIANSVFMSSSGRVPIPTGAIKMSESSSTLVTISIYVPGAQVSVSVFISTVPTQLSFITPPAKELAVGGVQTVALRLVGNNGLPLPSQRISVKVTRSDTTTCAGNECGQLTAGSSSLTQTDESGIALMSIAFSHASSGNFSAVFAIEPDLTGVAKLQETLENDAVALAQLGGTTADAIANPTGALKNIIAAATSSTVARFSSQLAQLSIDETTVNAILGAAITLVSDPQSAANVVSGYMNSTRAYLGVSAAISVWNPVSNVTIVHDPVIAQNVEVFAEQIQNRSWVTTFTFIGDSAPRFRLIDEQQRGVGNVPFDVILNILPEDTIPYVKLRAPDSVGTSDADGYVSLAGYVLSTSRQIDSLYFTVSSRGSRSKTTTNAMRITIKRASLQDVLQVWTFVLIFLFLPLFAGSVSHSRPIYGIVATVFAITMAVMVQVYFVQLRRDYAAHAMIQTYFWYIVIVAWLVAAWSLFLTVAEYASRRFRRLRMMRRFNAEDRAVEAFQYTIWLTNARVDKQPIELPEPSLVDKLRVWVERRRSGVEVPDDDVVESHVELDLSNRGADDLVVESTSSTAMDIDPHVAETSTSPIKARTPRRVSIAHTVGTTGSFRHFAIYRRGPRPALRRPKTVPDPTYYPTNIFVTLAIAIILVIVFEFFTMEIMLKLRRQLALAENSLPHVPEGDEELARNASRTVTDALSVTLTAISENDPKLAFLGTIVQPLRSVDVLHGAERLAQSDPRRERTRGCVICHRHDAWERRRCRSHDLYIVGHATANPAHASRRDGSSGDLQ
jgi:hypothetical protein